MSCYLAALDGMLQSVNFPRWRQGYHSGHYTHGLNIQAIYAVHFCFSMFSVYAPGKTDDAVDITLTDIQKFLDYLRPGLDVVGDASYVLLNRILALFTSSQRDNYSKYLFDYYLSQLIINIEMVFGLLQNKWLILLQPLPYLLSKSA